MPPPLWIQDGYLVTESGAPVECDDCPCPTEPPFPDGYYCISAWIYASWTDTWEVQSTGCAFIGNQSTYDGYHFGELIPESPGIYSLNVTDDVAHETEEDCIAACEEIPPPTGLPTPTPTPTATPTPTPTATPTATATPTPTPPPPTPTPTPTAAPPTATPTATPTAGPTLPGWYCVKTWYSMTCPPTVCNSANCVYIASEVEYNAYQFGVCQNTGGMPPKVMYTTDNVYHASEAACDAPGCNCT